MSVNENGTGMVVGKRENEVNGSFVLNLKVKCTLGSYKNKKSSQYDLALWGKLGESLAPLIKSYDNETKSLGTIVYFSGELIDEEVANGKYINKKVKLHTIDLITNLVDKDNQEKTESKSKNTKEKTEDKNVVDDDDF